MESLMSLYGGIGYLSNMIGRLRIYSFKKKRSRVLFSSKILFLEDGVGFLF